MNITNTLTNNIYSMITCNNCRSWAKYNVITDSERRISTEYVSKTWD